MYYAHTVFKLRKGKNGAIGYDVFILLFYT